MTVTEIIDTLGGRTKIRDRLGWPYTTIDSWGDHIPALRQPFLIAMAKSEGKRLTAADFPPIPPRKQSKAA